jgi:putative ABC transport system permease protein
MLNEFRFAIRQLLKNPGFTAVAVLTLALGIGVNAILFSVVDAILLKPLPFEEPDRLVVIDQKGGFGAFSGGDFRDLREQARSFSGVAATSAGNMNLAGDGAPVRINSARVSANLFAMLGKSPMLGRSFSIQEERPGVEPVVAISHGLWQRRFGGDPGVLGRNTRLDARSYTIVAVMPPGFSYPNNTEVWTPLALSQADLDDYLAYFLSLVARIKPETTLAQAEAELRTITARNEPRYPAFRAGWTLATVPLQDSMVGNVRRMLFTLQGAVGFVLFIACANVANLLLVRATRRQRELALRLTLGASRARLMKQLLVESVLLAALGCVVGLVLASAGPNIVRSLLPAGFPQLNAVAIDGRVLAFSLIVSALTALVFGLVPAWQMRGVALNDALKQSAATGSARSEVHRLRAGLVIAEFAVTMVLLAGAGLLIKSFFTLRNVALGFEPRQVLTACVELPERAYPTPERRLAFQRELIERIQALPGVQSAGIISRLPLSGGNIGGLLEIEGLPAPEFKPGGDMRAAGIRSVSPDYFRAIGIPLRQGRALASTDRETSQPVAVINEAMARKYWPNEKAVGRRVKPTILDLPWLEIVGVVGDVRHQGLDQRPDPELYVPMAQSPPSQVNLVLRIVSEPAPLAASIRSIVSDLDSDQPVYRLLSMEKLVTDASAAPRFRTVLLSAFGGLALLLAAVGIYGVMSFSVAQRTQEIGIRMALGAQRRDVLRLIVRQGARLVAAGGAIGIVATLGLTRLLRGFLYEVTPTDPVALILVAAVLAAIGIFACWLPARWAARVDPMETLRHE